MKFVQYDTIGRTKGSQGRTGSRLGFIDGNCVVDVYDCDYSLPTNMIDFVRNDYYWKRLKDLKGNRTFCSTKIGNVILQAPIQGMDKVIRMGNNYKGDSEAQPPLSFNAKFPSTVIGPNSPVLLRTNQTKEVDFGVSLCVVIGRIASQVEAKEASDYVFGYTIAQDIIANDWCKPEYNLGEYTLAVSMETFCPIGPWIVTPDEIGNVNNLNVSCTLNDSCRQESNTRKFVMKIPEIIVHLSSLMTLYPGDIILTGTPAKLPIPTSESAYLQPGDTIRSEIEKIGVLESKVQSFIPPDEIVKIKEILYPY